MTEAQKELDAAYEQYRQEGTKSLLAKDLADIVGSILFIGEAEQTEVLACIEKRQGDCKRRNEMKDYEIKQVVGVCA